MKISINDGTQLNFTFWFSFCNWKPKIKEHSKLTNLCQTNKVDNYIKIYNYLLCSSDFSPYT